MNLTRIYSMRVPLEDIINTEDEQLILENIRRCARLVGVKLFRISLWHKSLTQKDIKEFIKRNEHLLFEINTRITKQVEYAWFVIDTENEDGSRSRYRWKGDVLSGLVEYVNLVKALPSFKEGTRYGKRGNK